ncbi:MAG: sulfite exporter TauE/SafE family protein [Rhodospirillaceae bacterium]|nr:sulfite exporter TauE/SafE family protein [Rhodospirillaceae bacterium]
MAGWNFASALDLALGGHTPWLLAYGCLVVFLAAIVRGFSGFGFSMLAITAISLLMPPAAIIPAIFMLEIAASLHLLPAVWKQVHWRSLIWLIVGCAIATPLGVLALASVPAAPMKIALAVFVIVAAIAFVRGWQLVTMPGARATFTTGLATGLANGGFGMAGPPVVLFYFASPAGNAAGRASIIAFFVATDLMGLGYLGAAELVTWDSVRLAIWFVIPLLVGVMLGARGFVTMSPAQFRLWTLRILLALGVLTLLRGLWELVT